LFRALESVPPSMRKDNPEFRARDLALHGMFGRERFCSVCAVLDRDAAPCWPLSMPSHHAWHKVRAVRLALLEGVTPADEARGSPSIAKSP